MPGLIAYDGPEPVGWVSVSPRPEFGRVLRSRALRPGPEDEPESTRVWSVACFWVPRVHRQRGIGSALLAAAVEHARAAGAAVLEGYPVDTEARAPAAEIYTGTVGMFRRAGFRPDPTRPAPAGRRVVVRREL